MRYEIIRQTSPDIDLNQNLEQFPLTESSKVSAESRLLPTTLALTSA